MYGRSKSFKALNVALPIKREIDENLNKLQLEKRQFLALERQQADLKDRVERLRKEYNELRFSEFGTRNKVDKTVQNENMIQNVDRTQQITINSLKQLKNGIEVKRRQVQKYKDLNQKLNEDHAELQGKLNTLWGNVENKEDECQRLKKQIVEYRVINHKNVTEFQKSHFNLTRSEFKIENSRRKSNVMQSTFWGDEMKNSRALPVDKLSETLKNSGVHHNEDRRDIMTESVPLAKHRVAALIQTNRDKLKISDNYRKFGEGLYQMFEIMKKYKGREDLDFIAQEFVTKERQIQKLQQYVSTMQGDITFQKNKLRHKHIQDQTIKQILATKNENQIQHHYQKLNQAIIQQIAKLKQSDKIKTEWIRKVGIILEPLLSGDEIFNSSNAVKLIGEIQEKLQKDKKSSSKASLSPIKPQQQGFVPNLDLPQGHNKGMNELLNYEKMRQFAEEFIRSKNN